jgi:hypothetical protein
MSLALPRPVARAVIRCGDADHQQAIPADSEMPGQLCGPGTAEPPQSGGGQDLGLKNRGMYYAWMLLDVRDAIRKSLGPTGKTRVIEYKAEL